MTGLARPLTAVQQRVFDYIARRIARPRRSSPTYSEMARDLGYAHRSAAKYVADHLVKSGYLRRTRATRNGPVRFSIPMSPLPKPTCPHCGHEAAGIDCLRAARDTLRIQLIEQQGVAA